MLSSDENDLDSGTEGHIMTILIAYDGSADAKHAISVAASTLQPQAAVVVSVGESLLTRLAAYPFAAAGMAAADINDEGTSEKLAKDQADEGAKLARDAGLTDVTAKYAVAEDAVWEIIVQAADEVDASLIVLGSRGLNAVKSVLIGSVSNHVLHHAHRPVLIVPAPKKA
jgi:nucleotide-binding universal stress UspA family protein